MAVPSLVARLMLETAPHHAAANEHRLRGLEVTTLDAYRSFLASIFGFEAVVELLMSRLTTREHSWMRARMRAPLLIADLHTLGANDADLARLPVSANLHIPSLAHGLGWMFVLERHTLVAGQLLRNVEHVLGPAVGHATRYLGARGDRPGAAFRAFGEWLVDMSRSHAPALMIAGANEACRAQHQWYESTSAPLRPVASPRDVGDLRHGVRGHVRSRVH